MSRPNQIAKELHEIVFLSPIENAAYEDDKLIKRKTPDYNLLTKAVAEKILSPQDLTGEAEGWKTSTLAKIAIEGGFSQNLQIADDSAQNYRMIATLRKRTEKAEEFWENEEIPSGTEPNFLKTLAAKPASALVACRMELESFCLGLRSTDPDALREATTTAKLFSTSEAFQLELSAMKRFCRLESLLEENLQEKESLLKVLQETARNAAKGNFQALCAWKGGTTGMEIESALKLALFTGESGSETFDRFLASERKGLRKIKEMDQVEV